MDISRETRVLLTGAAGGLGSALAEELIARGARVALLDRSPEALDAIAHRFADHSSEIVSVAADLANADDIDRAIRVVHKQLGGLDILINSAGLMSFREFTAQRPDEIERMFKVNVLAPMQLSLAALPGMLERGRGQIVNVGSTFGSIGFAYFTSYSATKFALRGFSEALRRELEGTDIGVTYVAPRAIKTPLNSAEVYAMAKKTRMNMDEPSPIARRIIRAVEADKKEVYFGFPESFFARLNGLLPRLVDRGLRGQNRTMADFAKPPGATADT